MVMPNYKYSINVFFSINNQFLQNRERLQWGRSVYTKFGVVKENMDIQFLGKRK